MLNSNNFGKLVKSTDCSNENNIKVTFGDVQSMKDAENAWAWVHKDPKNVVIYVLDGKDCGGKNGRQPYYIKDIKYDENAKSAEMESSIAHWPEFADDAQITINTMPKAPAAPDAPAKRGFFDDIGNAFKGGAQKVGDAFTSVGKKAEDLAKAAADKAKEEAEKAKKLAEDEAKKVVDTATKLGKIDKNFNIPLNKQVDKNRNILKTDVKGVNLQIDCVDCHTKGSLDVDMTISIKDGFVGHATVKDDVVFHLGLGLTASGAVKGGAPVLEKSIRLFTAGLPGFTIPNVLEVGPSFDIDAQASIQSITGTVHAEAGAEMVIPKGNKIAIHSNDKTEVKPTFSLTPASITAEIDMVTRVNPLFTLNIGATFLKKGVIGGVGVAAPTVDLTTGIAASTKGDACPNEAAKVAAKLAVDIGVQVEVFGGFTGGDPAPNKKVVFEKQKNLLTKCIPIKK